MDERLNKEGNRRTSLQQAYSRCGRQDKDERTQTWAWIANNGEVYKGRQSHHNEGDVHTSVQDEQRVDGSVIREERDLKRRHNRDVKQR